MDKFSRLTGTRFVYGDGVQVRVSGTTSTVIINGAEQDVSHIVPAKDRVNILKWWATQGDKAATIRAIARRSQPLTFRVRQGWSTATPPEAA